MRRCLICAVVLLLSAAAAPGFAPLTHGSVGAAEATVLTHGSVGPGHGVEQGSRDNPCGGNLQLTYDGSAENGYGWQYGGSVPPYYGAFAECYDYSGAVCGIELLLTGIGFPRRPLDAYVWSDAGGIPGTVLSVTTGLDPGPVATWPSISTHDFAIPNAPVTGSFWIGYWADFSASPCGYFVAADTNGYGGCPYTNIAPGMGFPTGWNNVSVVWGQTAAIGIGVWVGHGEDVGACCNPTTGGCTVTPQADCPDDWLGPQTTCEPNPCPQPGACCHPDGSCTFVLQTHCSDFWYGQGSNCDPNPCPLPGHHTLYVDPSGFPSTYPWFPNIQAALSYPDLQPWDEILLMDGVFRGTGNHDINFLGRAVTVRSNSGNPAACIIDGGGYGGNTRGFLIVTGETGASVLQDLTISNQWKIMNDGGGILMSGASPTIRNCRLLGNVADGSYGGGIYCNGSNAHLIGCLITGNVAGGYHDIGGGGGIYAQNSNLTLENCTITGNGSMGPQAGGLVLDNGTIARTIIWGNCGGYFELEGSAVLTCCCVGSHGGGVLFIGPQVFTDPLFCDPEDCGYPTSAGDYSLQANSPCLPQSSPCGSLIGALWGCDPSGVGRESADRGDPATFALRILRNPTGGIVRYEFALPREADVRTRLYDAAGRVVRNWGGTRFSAGTHVRMLDIDPGEGPSLPPGVYYLRLEANGTAVTKALVVIR